MDPETADLLIAFVEKVGLLRRDIQHRKELDKYEGRFARIEQMVSKLAEHVAQENPDLATALRGTWQYPARALAFRNAAHQKQVKKDQESGDP
jgi:hypothetical protein